MRKLALGEPGDVTTVPQMKNAVRRWVVAPRPQKAVRCGNRAAPGPNAGGSMFTRLNR